MYAAASQQSYLTALRTLNAPIGNFSNREPRQEKEKKNDFVWYFLSLEVTSQERNNVGSAAEAIFRKNGKR